MADSIVENIPDEVDLFALMLQQSIITDDFDQEYFQVNSIQPDAPPLNFLFKVRITYT